MIALPMPRFSATLASSALAMASLVFVAWAKMETVQITYSIDELVDEEERLAEEQRRLRAELASLRSPSTLEGLAPALGLAPPATGQVVVVTSDPAGLRAALDAAVPSVPAAPVDSAVPAVPAAEPHHD